MNTALLRALSDELDHYHRLTLILERLAYDRGHGDGWRSGRAALLEEQAQAERHLYQHLEPVLMSPAFAELERRRWGPGGRARFGDPRPTDYRGGPVPWESRSLGAA